MTPTPARKRFSPRHHAVAAGLGLLASGLLSGCFPFPMYGRSAGSRDNASSLRDFSFVVPGRTSRAQVMMRLGEPDGMRDDTGRQVFYRSTHDVVGWAGYNSGGVLLQTNKYFQIEYDARGLVRRLSTSDQPDWMFATS